MTFSGFEHIGVEQTELANTGHCQLKRNLAAARSAPGNQYPCIAQKADIKERRYTRKKLIIIHSAILPALAIGRSAPGFILRSHCRASFKVEKTVCLPGFQPVITP